MEESGWESFWERQKHSFHEVMKIGTGFFALQLERLLGIRAGDEVLDYGCGPGFLVDYLEPKHIKITGADINNLFLKESRKNHPSSLFILITTNTSTNQDVFAGRLRREQFDYIVLLSIVQYFTSIDYLENVLRVLMP